MTPDRRAGAGQALHLAAARLGVMGLAALAAMLVARLLGPQDFGIYASGAAITPLVLAVGYGGMDQLFFRDEVDRDALPQLLAYLAALVLVSGLLLSYFMPGLEEQARVVAAVIFIGMAAEISRAWWLLECHRDGRLDVRGKRELMIRLASTAALVSAVLLAVNPVAPAVGQAATSVLLLALVTSRRRRKSGRARPARTTWKQFMRVLHKGRLYTATGAIHVLYVNMVGVLVATLSSAEEAGQFRIAFGFFLIAMAIPVALNNDGFRSQLFAARNDQDGTRGLRLRFARVNVGAAAVATAGVAFSAWAVVPLLLGEDFRGAVVPGYLLAAALPLTFLASYVLNLLVAADHTRAVITAQIIGLLTLTTLAFLWVPQGGAVGAARTMLAAETAVASMYCVLLLRYRGGAATV